jgi:polar amino acid transport system ATP-binding protein
LRIDIRDLAVSYGEKRVLRGLDLDIDVTALAIIGPSGCGKSTLLRTIGGLQAPTSGSISLDGERIEFDERTLPAYRATIGYVFQQGGLFQHLSAKENIALPLREVHGMDPEDADRRAMELLERFGLVEEADKLPAEMSGGQQQRAAIARAVAPHPRLLLFDEPTSALDPVYTNEVLDLIDNLRREGLRFIIVTHEMGFARNACETCAFLSEGKILESAPSAEFFERPQHEQTREFLGRLLEWR